MAGNGPAPAEVRRRRNEPARGDWIDLPPLEKPVLAELPELEGEDEWKAATRLMWEAWRSDPVTAQWSPADHAYALDAIKLHNGMTAATANEVRLRMDALGLTPKGKKDLRWRVAPADREAAAPRRRRSKATADRRARLSIVK